MIDLFRRLALPGAIAIFAIAGIGKLTPVAFDMFAYWGYAPWVNIAVFAVEVAGAAGLYAERTRKIAAAALAIVMVGAAWTHVRHAEWLMLVLPLAMLAVLMVAGQTSGPAWTRRR